MNGQAAQPHDDGVQRHAEDREQGMHRENYSGPAGAVGVSRALVFASIKLERLFGELNLGDFWPEIARLQVSMREVRNWKLDDSGGTGVGRSFARPVIGRRIEAIATRRGGRLD